MNDSGERGDPADPSADAWSRLSGVLKDVFDELGGGEAYLRAERTDFYKDEHKIGSYFRR